MGFIADFYAPSISLVIEVDGPIHADRAAEDRQRDRIMKQYQIGVLRFTNTQVLETPDSVRESIRAAVVATRKVDP